jgi:hypothetical protein
MRFHNKHFLLTTELIHTSDTVVQVYDSKFVCLNPDGDYKNIQVTLPNKITFRLSNVQRSNLVKISLAGINFSRENLAKILEYRTCKYKCNSLEELEKFPNTRSMEWEKDGYFTLNLFDRNPFAIHLYTGNRINYKI